MHEDEQRNLVGHINGSPHECQLNLLPLKLCKKSELNLGYNEKKIEN